MNRQQAFFCSACGGSGYVRGVYQKGRRVESYYKDCPQCHGVGHLCVHTLGATAIEPDRRAERRVPAHVA